MTSTESIERTGAVAGLSVEAGFADRTPVPLGADFSPVRFGPEDTLGGDRRALAVQDAGAPVAGPPVREPERNAPALPAPREKLAVLGKQLSALPQLQIELRHHFAGGLYAREGFIPKGSLFVGRVHHLAQLNIISQGDILVLTEQGPIRMTAPFSMVSPPGAQRGAYALEDTVWTTILATDLTDPNEIFNTLTSPSFEDYAAVRDQLLNIIEG